MELGLQPVEYSKHDAELIKPCDQHFAQTTIEYD